MNDANKNKDYLTTTQAAKLLSVSPDTVLKWVKAGKVKSYRTLGGHFRIPADGLNLPPSESAAQSGQSTHPPSFQYCWEYLAGDGEIKNECKDCITYRSRASRCYELKDLPGEFGCLNLLCDTDCSDCEYFKIVSDQGINVLVLSDTRQLVKDMDSTGYSNAIRIRFATCEYEAAVMIQDFRPDYIVIDCALGKSRTAAICGSLFSDIRIPVARIILSSKTKQLKDYCDREVFGWIQKPFSVAQLKECIHGVPELVDDSPGK
ncbi:MAG: helix-turn-helix domain-containing protein [Candidatus Latescibacterota bacterium]